MLRVPAGHVKDTVMLATPLDMAGGDTRVCLVRLLRVSRKINRRQVSVWVSPSFSLSPVIC